MKDEQNFEENLNINEEIKPPNNEDINKQKKDILNNIKLNEEPKQSQNNNKIIKIEDEKENLNIKQIINNYISHTENDPEYVNLIKTNPLSLFSSIDENKIKKWKTKLKSKCPFTLQINQNMDSEILKISLDNIRKKNFVINNDSQRTRVRECVIYQDFLNTLKKVLLFYCDKFNIMYKQGLNEIFGPLLLVKYKIPNITITEIINLVALIIDSFLPNYFYEKDIYSLKSGLGLFLILFKYHEPTVFNRLDEREVNPEIYATNWLVSYISGKLSLPNYFILWDEIIEIDDPLFIQFILLAVIIDKRELIINCNENLLPRFLTSLTINSEEELKKIINIAKELRKKTPYSFRLLADKIGFLKKKNNDIKTMYEKYHPELLPAMPIFPAEVLYITYKSQINCINPRCKNYLKEFAFDNPEKNLLISKSFIESNKKNKNGRLSSLIPDIDSNLETQEKCEKCDMNIEKTMQYILLDLRILEYDENDSDFDKTGFLPSMISVEQEELKSEDFASIMTSRFNPERGNYHFIFLTSSTDAFTDFELNYYIESISEEDRKKMRFGLIEQKKIDKELDLNIAKKNLTLKDIYKLKEYDNMRKTLKSMTKNNFPYVGYVYGGFNSVHEESKKYDIELLNHNEEICLLCNQDNQVNKGEEMNSSFDSTLSDRSELYNNLWVHKKKVSYKNLEVFFNNPNNKIHLCVLKEYRKNNINIGDVQILINLLYDKFDIEIYKFDNMRQYKDFENTFIIKNRKNKEKYLDYGKKDEDLNKDLELTLLEKVYVLDMLSINTDVKLKNVVICEIRGEKKKSGFFGLFKKKDDEEFETLNIVFDFSSRNEAREFILSFKDMMDQYRQYLKDKKSKKKK